MSQQHYPRWIPNPDQDAKNPSILVEDADQHRDLNSADFDAFQASLRAEEERRNDPRAGTAATTDLAKLYPRWIPNPDPSTIEKTPVILVQDPEEHARKHREDHALLHGTPIVGKSPAIHALKPAPPTIDEVLKAGYSQVAAEGIVAEEAGKAQRGELPYGPNAPTSDPKEPGGARVPIVIPLQALPLQAPAEPEAAPVPTRAPRGNRLGTVTSGEKAQ